MAINGTSIIILTFNSIKLMKPCLDSIYAQDCKVLDVIVVDNGSSDGTAGFIKNNYPQAVLIENKENLGACRARNQGIEVATGEWILTLDCDVILEKDFFTRIISFAEKSKESVGMFQPKILNMDKKTIYSCGIHLSWLKRFYDIGKGQVDTGQFNISQDIFGVCSAAAIYRRKMLDDIKEGTGYFDERLFFLVEDVDLSWRAQRKGWKALYFSEALCYHLGNSSNVSLKLRQYLCWRNRYYSIIKNEGLKNYAKKVFPVLFYDLPRLFYLFLTNHYLFKDHFPRDGAFAASR